MEILKFSQNSQNNKNFRLDALDKREFLQYNIDCDNMP